MVVVDRRCVASHSDARLEHLAIVGLVFYGDTYWYRFQALKASGRFEMGALLTAMQRGAAFGAFAFPIGVGRKRGGAVEAARSDDILQQPR
jgi:hypothetical protein